MRNQNKVSDFIIDGKPTNPIIIDKIVKYHLNPINEINKTFIERIYPSVKSSFRSYLWEKSKGRSGASQHCFGENKDLKVNKDALGATDWTCDNINRFKPQLLDALIKGTNYTRLCVYNTMIHGDYKPTEGGKRRLYNINSNGGWVFVKEI